MSEVDRDPLLTSLFAEAGAELEGEEFSSGVMARTRSAIYLLIAAGAVIALGMVLAAWAAGVPFAIAEALTRPLVLLPEGWVAWVASPVNNLGALLVVVVKGSWMAYKRSLR